MFTEVVGYLAGLCLALCFLPQVIKTWKTKSADDVAMGMLLLTFASAVGYQYYAWQLELTPVLIMNAIFTLLVLAEIILKIKFDGSI